MRFRFRHLNLGLVTALLIATPLWAADPAPDQPESLNELKKLSLEELFDLEVTSVTKKPERLADSAAAIHVVTAEDIARSGALSIPEALRDIPGVEVARVDSRQYAITARGFNGTVANKLLVLIDGRSVYTPLYSGVFWDAQDTLMEDVARIEVIRGPGATVWGDNAVNGVINVITKSAEETQGLLASGGAGTEERGFGGVRYGGRAGSNVFFRVYGKYFDRDESVLPNGTDAEDGFHMAQGGFRLDGRPSATDRVTLQGDVYSGAGQQPSADDVDLGGGNLVGRWSRTLAGGSGIQVQAYYDHTHRDSPPVFGEDLDTYDLDFQHHLPLKGRGDIVWGFGYRRTHDVVRNSASLAFLPAQLTQDLFTGFIQDETRFANDRVRLAVGTKLEHNDYTGFEYQPSVHLTWTPTPTRTLWTGVSRVVRTPSRIDRDFFVPAAPPFLLTGGTDFVSEVVHAFEVGYRMEASATLTASVSTFYNTYRRLRSLEAGPPFRIANGLEGDGYGLEGEFDYQPLTWWLLKGGYTYLKLRLEAEPWSTDTTQTAQEGDSPQNQLFLSSRMDLPHRAAIDLDLRWVDDLPNLMVPSYTSLDLRLAWEPSQHVELAIVGQNLLESQHAEFGTPSSRREIQRAVYVKATCRF